MALIEGQPIDYNGFWLKRAQQAIKQEFALELLDSRKYSLMQFEKKLLEAETKKNKLSVEDEIKNINEELTSLYSLEIQEIAEDEMLHFSPLQRYLLQKRYYLTSMVSIKNGRAASNNQAKQASKRTPILNLGGKILSFLDNAWGGIQSLFLADLAGPIVAILTGIFGFILYLGESIQGLKDAYKAYKNEKKRQRKTRIMTGVLSFMAAGAGVGVSIALFAGTLGATVSGGTLALAPILISAFFVAIYGLALWRNSYIFSMNKLDILKAHREKRECEVTIGRILRELSELKKEAKSTLSLLSEYATWSVALEMKTEELERCCEKSLRAERRVAFNSIDIFTSSMILVATIMGASILLGVSAASFGVVPLVLLIVGVVIGTGTQLFEYYDEQSKYTITRNIRNWFANQWNNFKSLFKRPEVTPGKKRYNSNLYEQFPSSSLSPSLPSSPTPHPSSSLPPSPKNSGHTNLDPGEENNNTKKPSFP